jgi:hypothetical protein
MKSNFIYTTPFGNAAAHYLLAEDNRTGILDSNWSDQQFSTASYALSPICAGSKFCVNIPVTIIGSGGAWRDFTFPAGATYSELYTFFKFRCDTITNASNFFNLQTVGGASNMIMVNLVTGGGIQINCGTANATTTGVISTGIIYSVWTHFRAGGGANAFASVGFSTDENEPQTNSANYAQVTTGTSTSNVALFDMEASGNGGGSYQFGKMRASTSRIGSCPA